MGIRRDYAPHATAESWPHVIVIPTNLQKPCKNCSYFLFPTSSNKILQNPNTNCKAYLRF